MEKFNTGARVCTSLSRYIGRGGKLIPGTIVSSRVTWGNYLYEIKFDDGTIGFIESPYVYGYTDPKKEDRPGEIPKKRRRGSGKKSESDKKK